METNLVMGALLGFGVAAFGLVLTMTVVTIVVASVVGAAGAAEMAIGAIVDRVRATRMPHSHVPT